MNTVFPVGARTNDSRPRKELLAMIPARGINMDLSSSIVVGLVVLSIFKCTPHITVVVFFSISPLDLYNHHDEHSWP